MIMVLYILLDVLLMIIIKKALNNPKSVKQYQKYINDKIFAELDFQMSSDNIPKFENKNISRISIYVDQWV